MTTTTTTTIKKKSNKRIVSMLKNSECRHADTEKLLGIFEEFDAEIITEAWEKITEGAPCHLSFHDVPDPGRTIKIGEEGRVPFEELSDLERLIPMENNLLPVHFLEEGAVVQRSVARVALTESYSGLPAGAGWGSGFLVSPSLFMTNNHVIESVAFAKKVKMQFNYQFDYMGNTQPIDTYRPDPDNVFYTSTSLDFTLVRLSPRCYFLPFLFNTGRNGGEAMYDEFGGDGGFDEMMQEGYEYTPNPDGPYPIQPGRTPITRLPGLRQPIRPPLRRCSRQAGARWGNLQLPTSGVTYATKQHVNVVQHPQGRRKEVALQENHIDDIYVNHVRYTTDTEPGSSGSPVFSNGWDLKAIHHAGGEKVNGQWVNNQGVRMDRIVADLRNHFQGTMTGNAILAELGI